MLRLLPKSAYSRNVITLMTGTGLAQAMPIAISPILTRMYKPEDFGIFAMIMAIVYISSVVVTGRYELAIMLPKNDRDAFNLLALALGLTCVVSIFLFVLIFLLNTQIAFLLGIPQLADWLFWIPASTLLTGIYSSLNYWSNRKSNYRRLAISRVIQAFSTSLPQLALGFLKASSAGLLSGQLIGQIAASLMLGRLIYRESQDKTLSLCWGRMMALAKKYKDFPRYLIVAHGFNTASGHIPVLFLGSLFNTAIAGYYTLVQRVMGAPMALVARALGDVFQQEASKAYGNTGNCRVIYVTTFKRLLVIASPFFVVFFFVAPVLFDWFFGKDWEIAGVYAQILTPMFFFQFITSPLSSMFMIAERQKLDLCWQIALFGVVILSFVFGYILESPKLSFIFFSFAYSTMYIINGLMTYMFTIRNKL